MLRMLSAITVLFSLLLAGCGGGANSAEGLVSELAKERHEISSALDAINDETAATDALPKIETAVGKINELNDKFNALAITPDKKQKLMPQLNGPGIELMMKKDALRLRNAAAFKIVATALDKMN